MEKGSSRRTHILKELWQNRLTQRRAFDKKKPNESQQQNQLTRRFHQWPNIWPENYFEIYCFFNFIFSLSKFSISLKNKTECINFVRARDKMFKNENWISREWNWACAGRTVLVFFILSFLGAWEQKHEKLLGCQLVDCIFLQLFFLFVYASVFTIDIYQFSTKPKMTALYITLLTNKKTKNCINFDLRQIVLKKILPCYFHQWEQHTSFESFSVEWHHVYIWADNK